MALVNDGAALLIKESELESKWEETVDELLSSGGDNQKRCEKLQLWARPHAADEIVSIMYNDIK